LIPLQAKIALSVRFGRGLTLPSLDCSSVLRLRFRALMWDKVRRSLFSSLPS
jgi:hypothetical protein